ncbi:MAG: CvpA family protein [Bacteroides sp.]|nr:CvpA family protein [Bacteroides sp.]MCM1413938.1 CvpA family protein [Bacteroides sp.]MCM1471635.1 CvpA family protein [Bacteroides sp.]
MLDLIICVAVGVSLFAGYRRGILRQIASLVSIVVAFIACRLFGGAFSSLVASMMGEGSSTALMAPLIGNILLFLIVWWGLALVAGTLRSLLKAVKLGVFDNILGALFMAFKVMIVASLLLNFYDIVTSHDITASNPGPIVRLTVGFAPAMLGVVRSNF